MDQQGKQIKITLIVDVSQFALTIIDPWHHYAYWERAGLKFDEYLMVFILFCFVFYHYQSDFSLLYISSALLKFNRFSLLSWLDPRINIKEKCCLGFCFVFYLCGLT